MTPEERQLLTGLFDRLRANSGGQRDPQAENFIAEAVRAQPYAPYIMAQNVILMEQTLQAASQRIEELEGQLQAAQAGAAQGQGGGSFLGNAARSMFGGAAPLPGSAPQRGAVPPSGGYAPPPQSGPWGQQAQPQYAPQASGGGGFLKGALGAAAGVAGGVLLADSLRGLFGGHGGGGLGSMFGGTPGGGSETITNNYYGDSSGSSDSARQFDPRDDVGTEQDQLLDAADDSSFDSGGDSGTYDA